MADRPPFPEPTTNTPRWVKVFGVIVIIVVLLLVGVMLLGGGSGHGPDRHGASGGADGPADAAETGLTLEY